MPLSTSRIIGTITRPDSAALGVKGKFTLEILTSDGTLREEATGRVMATAGESEVGTDGVIDWPGIVSIPQAGVVPSDARYRLRFASTNKLFQWSAVIDTLPAGDVDFADLTDVSGFPLTPSLVTEAQDAADAAEGFAATAQAAATAAAAVGATNDTIIAGRINDPASATKTALTATFVPQNSAALTPYQFGAVPPVSGSNNTAALAALWAQAAATGAEIYLPAGKWYTTAPLVPFTGMVLSGAGRDNTYLIAKGTFSGTGLFEWNAERSGIRIGNLRLDNGQPGVHLFHLGAAGGIDAAVFENVWFVQQADNARIWNQDGSGSFIQVEIKNAQMYRTVGNTLSPWYVRTSSGAANCNRFSQIRLDGSNNILAPFMHFESTLPQTYLTDWTFDTIIGEQNPGGLIKALAPCGWTIVSATDEDATVPYAGDIFAFLPNASALSPRDVTLIGSSRRGSSLAAGVKEIRFDTAARGVTLIACNPTPVSAAPVIVVPTTATLLGMRNAANSTHATIGAPLALPSYTTATRPTATDFAPGTIVWDSTVKRTVSTDGTAWKDPGALPRPEGTAVQAGARLVLSNLPFAGGGATITLNKDIWRYMPLHLDKPLTISDLAIFPITNASGGTAVMRLAIYAATSTGLPGALVEDFGVVGTMDLTTGGGGEKSLVLPGGRTFGAGRYFIACAWSGTATTAPTIYGLTGNTPMVASTSSVGSNQNAYTQTISGATTPATAATAGAVAQGVSIWGVMA